MSSRNVRLRGDDRERALALVEGLDAADAAVRAGETDVAEVESVATKAMLARGVGADYVAVVDPTTLAPLERIDGRALLVVAAHVGPVRQYRPRSERIRTAAFVAAVVFSGTLVR